MAHIELVKVNKRFISYSENILDHFFNFFISEGGLKADPKAVQGRTFFSIDDLDLVIPDGKTMVILGPSGCGKTTLLRIIAGLIPPDSGEIRFDEVDVKSIPPKDRKIGMIFQNYALYPNFTSKENILSYFIFRKKTPDLDRMARERFQRTSELLGVDIAYLLHRKPKNLSAGEKQRVALGRCITRDPSLFLLDEPFSHLDQKLREKYRINLKILLNHFNITTVYVTHDQQEALILSDIVAVMDHGKIDQVGTYEELYNFPKNIFVADFLSLDVDAPAINLLDGAFIHSGLSNMIVGVRPQDVEIVTKDTGSSITGFVSGIRHVGLKDTTILYIKIGQGEIVAKVNLNKNLSVQSDILLRFRRYHIFDKHSGQRIKTI
jgi:multiple sugar transport system ATP-binding protein